MSLGDVPPDLPPPPAPTPALKLASARQTSLYRQLLDSGVLALAARGPLGSKGVAGIFGPLTEAAAKRTEAAAERHETADTGDSGDHVEIPEGFEPAARETPETAAQLYRRRGGGAWALRLKAEHSGPGGQAPGTRTWVCLSALRRSLSDISSSISAAWEWRSLDTRPQQR